MSDEKERKNQKKWRTGKKHLLILLNLSVFTLVSSVIVLFHLGARSTPDYLGKMIDTIVLSPAISANDSFHFSGRVMFADGTPAVGKTVVLHSEPRYAVSNNDGMVVFPGVAPGKHTMMVLNTDGTVAAQCEVEIERHSSASETNTVFTKTEDNVNIQVSMNLRLLEVCIQLDKASGQLSVTSSVSSELTRSGNVRTAAGMTNVSGGAVVSPGGSVYMPDGSIIIPSIDPSLTAIINRDDTVTYLSKDTLRNDGTSFGQNGEIVLQDGTIISSGIIRTLDGAEKTPGNSGVQVLADDEVGKTEVVPIGFTGTGDETRYTEGQLSFEDLLSWTQGNEINLFYERTKGIDSYEMIAPGSAGYYLFELSNPRTRTLDIVISIEEKGELQLPFHVMLTPLNADGKKITKETVSEKFPEKGLIFKDSIESGAKVVYLLEWEWPFEGNDETDTRAGIELREYTLSLGIHVEEK